jgi:hypothetical protein
MSEGKIKVYDRRLSNREIADLLPLSAERQRERDMLVEEQNLLKQCLSAMPVGYIPTHTAENLPEMIGGLAKALAEETTERENLERELAAERVLADQLGIALNRAMEIIPDPDELSYTERIKTLRWEKLIAAWKEARSEPDTNA